MAVGAWLRHELQLALLALQFFTRLPVPAWVVWSPQAARASARYLPAVGWVVGAAAALVYAGAVRVWPLPVAVLLSMAATLLLTGAFHEDGLADTADGLGGGGHDTAKVLAILQDPRIGSFGAVALVMALGLKFALLVAVPAGDFALVSLGAHAASRCSALWVMVRLPYLRDDGPSKSRPVAQPLSPGALLFAVGCATLPLPGLGMPAAVGAAGCVVVAGGAVVLLRRRLGGYVGDTLGAVQQCAELAFLLGCVAMRPPVLPL